MKRRKKMMAHRNKTACLITVLFTFIFFSLPLHTCVAASFDDVEKELVLLDKYYQKKQYRKAGTVLNRIVKETGIDDGKKNYALDYPESIRSSIKYWQNVFRDRKGYFRDYPRVTGVVVEHFGNMAGYFRIRKSKEIISFTYERALFVVGGEISKGKKVTVYYIPDSGEFDTAVKVEVHK